MLETVGHTCPTLQQPTLMSLQATVTMPSSFDRSLSVSIFDKLESGQSVWDANRSIWQDNSAETENTRRMATYKPSQRILLTRLSTTCET